MSLLEQSRNTITIPPNLKNKIQILESNVGRVYHQHQTLKSLLKYQDRFNQLQQVIKITQSIKEKIIQMKNKVEILKMKAGLKRNSFFIQHGSIQNNYKIVNTQMYNVKYRIASLQKQLEAIQTKQYQNKIKIKIFQCGSDVNQKIKKFKSDIRQFLTQIKQKQFKFVDKSIKMYLNQYFKKQNQDFTTNLKRQIGMLYCQVAFYIQNQRKKKIKQKLLEIKKTSKNYMQQSIKTGQYQCKMLEEQYKDMIFENNNRLNYELNLIQCKIEQLKQCLKYKQRSASKNSSSKKNNNFYGSEKKLQASTNKKNYATNRKIGQQNQCIYRQLIYLNDKLFSIENQQNGIVKFIKDSQLRIHFNLNKLNTLLQRSIKHNEGLAQDLCYTFFKSKSKKSHQDNFQNQKLLEDNQKIQLKIKHVKHQIQNLKNKLFI